MKISVKLLSKEAPVVLDVANDATVKELKDALQEHEGISARQQQVVFKRRNLEDNSRLTSEYQIVDGSTVVILVLEKAVDETDMKVPIDRVFDESSGLSLPYNSRGSRGNHSPPEEGDSFTFKEAGPEKVSFVRVSSSGEETLLYGHCEWVSFDGEVLHFNGDGCWGTFVKGIGVAATSELSSDSHKPDHLEVMDWLRLNFAQDEKIQVSSERYPFLSGTYTVDPDNQNPRLRYFRHGQPFGKCYRKVGTNRTLWPDREGNWCLAEDYRYNDTTGETGNLYDGCPVFPWAAKFRGDVIVEKL